MLGKSRAYLIGKHSDPQGAFGVALARKRIRAKLSQTDLATICGRHRVTIARWETGVSAPVRNARFRDAMWLLDKLAGASDFERRKLLIERGIV
jgi:transcriptional regulator with XRE-family HTH domain